jgi:hypothetical protein
MPRFVVTLYDHAQKTSKALGFIEADNAHDATLKAWRRWTHHMPSHCLFVHESRFRTVGAEAAKTAQESFANFSEAFDPQL